MPDPDTYDENERGDDDALPDHPVTDRQLIPPDEGDARPQDDA
jgi:hypothetical protein